MKNLILLSMLLASVHTFADTCEELPVGSSFTRDVEGNKSSTKVQQSYSLFRESLDTYEVLVNLQFLYGTRDAKNEMREKVASCLEQKSLNYTKKSAIKLKLKLYDEQSDAAKLSSPPPLVQIYLAEAKARANSGAYPVDIDCSVIVHEVLHLTGLVDEYDEVGKAQELVFVNRAKGPSNSVMSSNGTYIFLFTTQGKLYPAHIRHVLYPECQEKNSVYYTCAKDAYSTDRTFRKPGECRKKSWLN